MNRRFGTERLVEKQDLFILQIQQVLENPFTISYISLMLQKANQRQEIFELQQLLHCKCPDNKAFFLSALKELFLRDGLINENQMHT